MDNKSFHTFSQYMKNPLTASMEDYLEMIYRMSQDRGFTRINDLSKALSVSGASTTKMVQRLAELGYIDYERYGVVTLKELGEKKGAELILRHNIIQKFLEIIGVKSLLEETEKIEHTISVETLECINRFVNFLLLNENIINDYKNSD